MRTSAGVAAVVATLAACGGGGQSAAYRHYYSLGWHICFTTARQHTVAKLTGTPPAVGKLTAPPKYRAAVYAGCLAGERRPGAVLLT